MSSGRVHARDSQWIAALAGLGAAILTRDPLLSLSVSAGSLAGIVLSPDQDQEGISRSEWQIIKYSLGFGFLWVWYWLPYALLHKHRGSSHWPIVGTVVRCLYLVPIFLVLWRVFSLPAPDSPPFWLLPAFIGLSLSDLAHFLRDRL